MLCTLKLCIFFLKRFYFYIFAIKIIDIYRLHKILQSFAFLSSFTSHQQAVHFLYTAQHHYNSATWLNIRTIRNLSHFLSLHKNHFKTLRSALGDKLPLIDNTQLSSFFCILLTYWRHWVILPLGFSIILYHR